MRLFIVIIVLFFVTALHAESNQFSESHLKAAKELVETVYTEKLLNDSITEMIDLQTKENSIFQKCRKEIEQFLKKYMDCKSLKDEYIKMYVDAYTEKELIELTKFYKTPLGNKTIAIQLKTIYMLIETGQKVVHNKGAEFREILMKGMEEDSPKKNTKENSQPKLGSKAPPLDISSWAKGDPVIMETGKVYVVEFWATWCPPCLRSIPHITEVQQKFKDKGVVIIGVSSEDAETVKPFVEEMGEKMEYVVAIDNDRKTSSAYMKPFNVRGIPHAFVIDKEGNISWHGHPASGLEEAIEDAL